VVVFHAGAGHSFFDIKSEESVDALPGPWRQLEFLARQTIGDGLQGR
jgi:hypothetical protein